jgi:glycolate oxidase FAD binding subunit
MPEGRALETMNRWAGMPLPVSATTWQDGALAVRLSGAPVALGAAANRLGGERVDGAQADRFWQDIREQIAPFFAGDAPLWRLSLPSAAPPLALPCTQLIEWNGGLRWLRTAANPAAVRAAAEQAVGHATRFRAGDRSASPFAPLAPVLARLHRELKAVFDPAGILNRGRLYAEF